MGLGVKLQIRPIIFESVKIAWKERGKIINSLTLPILFLVVIYALWSKYAINLGLPIMLLVFMIFCLVSSWFTITCHRLILLRDYNVYTDFNFIQTSLRALKFIGIAIQVYVVVYLVKVGIMTGMVVVFNMRAILNNAESLKYWIELSDFCSLYILGRLSLVFPATAIDKKISLKCSWLITRGNGFNMFVIVGALPLLLKLALSYFGHNNENTIEIIIISMAGFIILTIEIFMLSLTHREFESYYTKINNNI